MIEILIPATLPDRFKLMPLAGFTAQDGGFNIFDTDRPSLPGRAYSHQLVARIFGNGKVVMWIPPSPDGKSHVFKTYNEAREYVQAILGMGLIYENMPEIFTWSK